MSNPINDTHQIIGVTPRVDRPAGEHLRSQKITLKKLKKVISSHIVSLLKEYL
jgi:hypothetical protein